jgi:EamA-like transporter family.
MPFASLLITYSLGAVVSLILFFAFSREKNFFGELKKTNWASWVFGCALVGMEVGYIYVYRNGWPISFGSIVINICTSCILLVIGCTFYKEKLSRNQVLGMLVCVVGLVFINL